MHVNSLLKRKKKLYLNKKCEHLFNALFSECKKALKRKSVINVNGHIQKHYTQS